MDPVGTVDDDGPNELGLAPRTGASERTHDTGGPITNSLAWATWALFVGLGMMLSGAGLFATIIGIRAELEGFATLAIGLVTAAYYLGFLIGSRLALAALARVGHIRVYAAFASILAASILFAGMAVNPWVWIGVRFIAGACLAGQYVVAESWLNQLVTNANRGRILSLYSLVTIVAYGIGQVSIGLIDPTTLTAFGIAAIAVSVAVSPVALSEEAAPPIVSSPEKMSLRELFSIVPTGVVTSILVGIAHGSFLGLAAVYATRAGLSKGEIGVFVALPTLGSLLLTIPISAASDDIDRRAVGALAALTTAGAGLLLVVADVGGWTSMAAMVLIGGTTYPLYSIAGAYTNDWIPAEKLTAVASQLVVLYGAGAFVGPFLASIVMRLVGNSGFAWTVVGVHAIISVFLVVRMLQWRAPIRAKPWNEVALAGRVFYLPATAVGMGRRIRQTRNGRIPLAGPDALTNHSIERDDTGEIMVIEGWGDAPQRAAPSPDT